MNGDERRLLNEAPTVVGMLTSVIESEGSLDAAVRIVAEDGPALSGKMFARAAASADTKQSKSVKDALLKELGGVGEGASGYRQSVMMCISASESGDRRERLSMLEEASDAALDAVRIMGERYSASLTVPCMTVFSMCVVVPMIMMTILPMLSIGDLFGPVPVDGGMVLGIVLVAIPGATVAVCAKLRADNPFIPHERHGDGAMAMAPLLIAVPLYPALSWSGMDPQSSLMLSAALAAASCAILLIGDRVSESRRARSESALRDSVFSIGNSLLGGVNFERAAVDALSSRPGCAELGSRLGRELDICRGDVEGAVARAVSPVSQEVSRTLCDISRCSRGDMEDAGRLAMTVGRQYQNAANVTKELELGLKSMTDMMSGTAAVFAPMVLGMSLSLLGPLSRISGYSGSEGTGLALAAYVIELCALIAILTSSLGTGGSLRSVLWRFSLTVPMAMIVFAVCTTISLRRGTGISRGSSFRGHGLPETCDPRRPRPLGGVPRPGADGAVHGSVRFVRGIGRQPRVHRREVGRARGRRVHVRIGGPHVPSAGGAELHSERVPAPGLHARHRDRGRIGRRLRLMPASGPPPARPPLRGRGMRARRADGRGMGGGDDRVRFPPPEDRFGGLRGHRRDAVPVLAAPQGSGRMSEAGRHGT